MRARPIHMAFRMRQADGPVPGTPVRACGGFTLIELIVTLAIVAIIMLAMGFEFVGWKGKYEAESDLKTMYADLSNARAQAIQTKSVYFVNIPASDAYNYKVFIDNAPTLDGDGVLNIDEDGLFINTSITYFINTQERHLGFTKSGLIFTDAGVLQSAVRIVIEYVDEDGNHSSPGSDLDCLELVSTRINLGLFDGSTSECVTR